jgi:hypothetical protein
MTRFIQTKTGLLNADDIVRVSREERPLPSWPNSAAPNGRVVISTRTLKPRPIGLRNASAAMPAKLDPPRSPRPHDHHLPPLPSPLQPVLWVNRHSNVALVLLVALFREANLENDHHLPALPSPLA